MGNKPALVSQFNAALMMFKQTIEKCPDDLWDHPSDQPKYWQREEQLYPPF
jgi:hypothetical protein